MTVAKLDPSRPTINITTPYGVPRGPAPPGDDRPVIWFDLDNCVYSKKSGISEMMKEKIGSYFKRLGLPPDEAAQLHHHYYTEYGLAIRGLVRHHQVDPLDYDEQCDAALPLENVLHENKELKEMLDSVDRSKFRVWALTNAYKNHATRVLSLIGLQDCFEGVVSCDYGAGEFFCKPEKEYYAAALTAAGSPDPSKCYFVDDSALNMKGANAVGWAKLALFDELGDESRKLNGLDKEGKVSVIGDILELRKVWSEVFVQGSA
ncbi:pyrimidine 5'-nucleotidase [Pseudohyphozyma bogoriensis]|nr:pyrimidine 5'-nucleotidase [Pseudohyphozyma bogoriensis]